MDTGLTYLSLGHPAQQLDQSQTCDGLSDNFLVLSELEFSRPECVKIKFLFIRINKIDLKNFQNSVNNMIPFSNFKLLILFIHTILNKHARLLNKTVSERPPTPWRTQEILAAKVRRRRLERVWRRARYRRDRSR